MVAEKTIIIRPKEWELIIMNSRGNVEFVKRYKNFKDLIDDLYTLVYCKRGDK